MIIITCIIVLYSLALLLIFMYALAQLNLLFNYLSAQNKIDISKLFDFSNNNGGSHVKNGGSMINGTKYIDVYIFYKNKDKWHCFFAYVQDQVDTNPYIMTRKYQGGMMNKESVFEIIYEIENIDKAKLVFIENLEEIIDK